jgi:uncharacterized protein YeaO (DUF488 family)
MVAIKRVYEQPRPQDGRRFLVERLWPRGMKKESLKMDGWLRDVAPSDNLRRWFSHDPAKWNQFRNRYWSELDEKPEAVTPLVAAASHGTVTLLYSAHDTKNNNAVALKEYIEKQIKTRRKS